MWEAIGDTLPLALGLALSPFAMVTGIVLLLGAHGRTKTLCFGIGWFTALLGIAAVALWVVEEAEQATSGADAGVDLVQLAIGALFLVLAAMSLRRSGRRVSEEPTGTTDVQPEKPGLLDRLDGVSAGGALGVGIAQGLLVIKNIPLAVGAGMSLGEAGLSGSQAWTALIVFALIASLGVLVPLVAATFAGKRFAPTLQSMRVWTEQHMTSITVSVLLVLAGVFLGQGIGILG